MPGKVNPVIPEMVIAGSRPSDRQRCRHHLGGRQRQPGAEHDDAVDAHNLLESIELLANASTTLRVRCVEGIEADRVRAGELAEANLIVVDRPQPSYRLRQGRRGGQGGLRLGAYDPRGGAGERSYGRGGARPSSRHRADDRRRRPLDGVLNGDDWLGALSLVDQAFHQLSTGPPPVYGSAPF